MDSAAAPERSRDSRILVFSQRRLASDSWLAAQFEFEDLLVGMDDVSLVAPLAQDHQHMRSLGRRAVNATLLRSGWERRSPLWPAPSMQSAAITTQHDVFFAVFHHAHQLSYLHRLDGWRDRAKKTVCLLVELWTPTIETSADYLQLLREFDHVYVVNPSMMSELPRRLGIPVPAYLPMAVDALTLSPLARMPDRVVDVYSYGRRSDVTHQVLLDLVEQTGLTYLYDSLGDARFRNHREHRLLLANMMKRARYFLAHTINDSPDRRIRTGGDEALSTRYFEGTAGGAVLLGSRPQTVWFDRAFPWKDAVVSLPYDSTNVPEVLGDLDRQPERLARIRADNVRGSLTSHDWGHRWAEVLRDLGLPALPGLEARLAVLAELAVNVEPAMFMTDRRRVSGGA